MLPVLYSRTVLVLIESDWNLKKKGDRITASLTFSINRIRLEFKAAPAVLSASANAVVLIESDWNLKTKDSQVYLAAIGINRIRLEFKDITEVNEDETDGQVLIESDWNLKKNLLQQVIKPK